MNPDRQPASAVEDPFSADGGIYGKVGRGDEGANPGILALDRAMIDFG